MGLFNLFKSSKIKDEQIQSIENNAISDNELTHKTERDVGQILTRLNVNPLQYNHDEMNPCEVSLEAELRGEIRTSDLTLEEDDDDDVVKFTYISLSDYANGKKDLYLSFVLRNERNLKRLIDEFSIELGESLEGEKEFTHGDLMEVRGGLKGNLRTWYEDEYKVSVGFVKEKRADINPRVQVYVVEV